MTGYDHEAHYREEWMSDDQWECALLAADLAHGFHHLAGEPKPCGLGVAVLVYAGAMATFDYDMITRIVVLSHDRMIRVEIRQGGPNRFKLCIWKRHKREGAMGERMPTLERHVTQIRAHYGEPSQ